jgi:hypothetical protein
MTGIHTLLPFREREQKGLTEYSSNSAEGDALGIHINACQLEPCVFWWCQGMYREQQRYHHTSDAASSLSRWPPVAPSLACSFTSVSSENSRFSYIQKSCKSMHMPITMEPCALKTTRQGAMGVRVPFTYRVNHE